MVKKKLEDIFIRFGATPERDRQTDGHRVTAYTALMHMHRAVKIKLKSKVALSIGRCTI